MGVGQIQGRIMEFGGSILPEKWVGSVRDQDQSCEVYSYHWTENISFNQPVSRLPVLWYAALG
jgi:hypothetical protein